MSLKKWLLFALIFLGIFISLPYLFSFFPFKQVFEYGVGKKYNQKIRIEKINLTWFGPQTYQGISFKNTSLDGSIQQIQSETPFWKLTSNQKISLQDGLIHVHIENFSTVIENLNATINDTQIQIQALTKKEGHTGKIEINGTYESPDDLNLSIQADQVPTLIVDQYLKKDKSLLALIGPSFNLNLKSQMKKKEGFAKFNFQSLQIQAIGDLSLTPQIITLNNPLSFSAKISDPLSQFLPYQMTSSDPILVQIDSNGFSLPRNLDFSQIQIQNATLNLGRIYLKNATFLDQPLSFFKTPKKANHEADFWFTPFRFSIKNQKIKYERTDFLINSSLHLCSWGKIDSNSKKLDLILGVPTDTLTKNFHLANLPSDFVLQIPVTGSIEKPKIDTKNAAKTIATLLASDQLKKGGGIFKGIGQIIDQSQKEKAPKPNLPFPWE